MAPERVADMTIKELKALIAEVVAQLPDTRNRRGQFVAEEEHTVVSVLPNGWVKFSTEVGPNYEAGCYLVDPSNLEVRIQGNPDVATSVAHEDATRRVKTPLPQRTKAEQRARNQTLIEWLDKWREEGDEEEQRETFEYLKKVLDEDRLSNRPLFPQQ